MTTKQPRWRTMMVALSTTSASSKPLLRKALQLAERFDASVRLVHVITPTYAFIPDELHLRSKQLQALLDRQLRRSKVKIETTVVRDYPRQMQS